MIETRTAIYQKITADVDYMALSTGGVHYGIADENASFPLTIFNKHQGRPRWTFGGLDGDSERFLIKAVAQNTETENGQGLAELMMKSLKAILTDIEFAFDGGALIYLRHERDIPDYQEQRSDGTIFHVGSIFRVETNVS